MAWYYRSTSVDGSAARAARTHALTRARPSSSACCTDGHKQNAPGTQGCDAAFFPGTRDMGYAVSYESHICRLSWDTM